MRLLEHSIRIGRLICKVFGPSIGEENRENLAKAANCFEEEDICQVEQLGNAYLQPIISGSSTPVYGCCHRLCTTSQERSWLVNKHMQHVCMYAVPRSHCRRHLLLSES